MKKTIIISILTVISILANICFVSAQEWWWMSLSNQSIFNRHLVQVLDTNYNWVPMDINPIEIWISDIIIWEGWSSQISWLVWTDDEITEYSIAMRKIMKVIQNVVNYFLWILWVVALIYLIIHWFMILTAAGDDSKMKKWLKWVKNAFIAIAWIWLSRLIISFILWLINTLTA